MTAFGEAKYRKDMFIFAFLVIRHRQAVFYAEWRVPDRQLLYQRMRATLADHTPLM
jgi:hypothetical protein